ncbi:MAG: MFS transporter, partial [Nitrospinota bacterium]
MSTGHPGTQAQTSSPRATFSWALYDFANTIFSMNVVSMYFPLLIVLDYGLEDIWVSLANSSSMLLVAASMPTLGALADGRGNRKRSLFLFTALSCAATGALGFASGAPSAAPLILLFVASNYFYQGGLVFYNSLLPAVASPGREGRVSGFGVSLGYLGSIAGLLLVQPFNEGKLLGWNVPFIKGAGRGATFLPTAALFFLFALPLFFRVGEPPAAPSREKKGLIPLLAEARRIPGLLRFLTAKFLYEDAVQTVIVFMAVYAKKVVGFSDAALIPFFILSTTCAASGSLLWGSLTDRLSPKRVLVLVLLGWLLGLFLVILPLGQRPFWALGSALGALLGGTWTAARPLMLSLTPEDRYGELFAVEAREHLEEV